MSVKYGVRAGPKSLRKYGVTVGAAQKSTGRAKRAPQMPKVPGAVTAAGGASKKQSYNKSGTPKGSSSAARMGGGGKQRHKPAGSPAGGQFMGK